VSGVLSSQDEQVAQAAVNVFTGIVSPGSNLPSISRTTLPVLSSRSAVSQLQYSKRSRIQRSFRRECRSCGPCPRR
jgi:hypothetical protein